MRGLQNRKSPEPSFSEAVFPVVRRALKALRRAEDRVREGEGGEALHDLRIAINRLRGLLALLGDTVPAKTIARLLHGFRRRMKNLGPARDADVLREAVGKARCLSPSERRELARPVRRLKISGAFPEDAAEKRFRDALDNLADLAKKPPRDGLARVVLPEKIFSLIRPVLEKSPEAWAHASHDELHGLRKKLRLLRYSLDAVKGFYGTPVAKAHATTRELLETLGELHDAAAFADALADCDSRASLRFLAHGANRSVALRRKLPVLLRRGFGPRALGRLGEHLGRRAGTT